MRRLDRLHLELPFAGARMLRGLLAAQGCKIGRRHVKTLMRRMGIEALYRRPRTTKPEPGHRIYPYLLRGVEITRPNQVWAMDRRVKDLDSHSVRALLASRALLVKIKRDLENQIRGLLKNVGLVIGRAKFNVFAVRAEELIEDRPELVAVVGPLLKARKAIEPADRRSRS